MSSAWAIVPLFGVLLSGVALALAIGRLVTTLRRAFEASVELVPEQEVALPTGGTKIVYLRAPRFTDVSALKLSMRTADGTEVPLTRVLYRLSASGRDIKQAYARCELPGPGRYSVSASNIPTAARPLGLLFGPPNGLALVVCIVAIVMSGMLTIGSLVASILLLTGTV